MKRGSAWLALIACALLCPVPTGLRGQDNPVKSASDFSSVEYFDPPHELQISSRLSGSEAVPLTQDTAIIKNMKLETFDTNGVLQYVVEAPECLYDQNKGVASSSGHLKVRQANGQRELAGDGFLWRQSDEFLYISNRQRTVINITPGMKLQP